MEVSAGEKATKSCIGFAPTIGTSTISCLPCFGFVCKAEYIIITLFVQVSSPIRSTSSCPSSVALGPHSNQREYTPLICCCCTTLHNSILLTLATPFKASEFSSSNHDVDRRHPVIPRSHHRVDRSIFNTKCSSTTQSAAQGCDLTNLPQLFLALAGE